MPVSTIGTSIGIGTCFSHDYPISIEIFPISGSPNGLCGGSLINKLGDICMCSCGHLGMIVTGSTASIINSFNKAETGSIIIGLDAELNGVIISGNPKNLIGR